MLAIWPRGDRKSRLSGPVSKAPQATFGHRTRGSKVAPFGPRVKSAAGDFWPSNKGIESRAFRAPCQKRRRRLLAIEQGDRKSRLSGPVSKAPQATFGHRTRGSKVAPFGPRIKSAAG